MSNTKPTLSAVVPVYNSEKYIAGCLDSILAQEVAVDEIVVILDGCTDGTSAIVEKYAKESKIPINIIRERRIDQITGKEAGPSGIGYSRRKGVMRSFGDYVAFCSADDRWKPNFVKDMMDGAKAYPNTILYANFEVIGPKGEHLFITQERTREYEDFVISCWDAARRYKMFVNFSTTLFPRPVFEKVNFRREYVYGEDLMFLLESITLHSIPYACIPAVVAEYREHDSMTTKTEGLDKIKENDERIIHDVFRLKKERDDANKQG